MKTIQPLAHCVLILPDGSKKAADGMRVTAGGIIMPDEAARSEALKSNFGVVVAVGDGYFEPNMGRIVRPCRCKPGDRVFYINFGANKIEEFEGESYILLEDVQIMGVVVEEDVVVTPPKEIQL